MGEKWAMRQVTLRDHTRSVRPPGVPAFRAFGGSPVFPASGVWESPRVPEPTFAYAVDNICRATHILLMAKRRTHQKSAPWIDEGGVEATVALLSVIAHPLRLKVLLLLGERGPRAVGDLQTELGAEQSGLSHQLRILRDARLVIGERDKKRVLYRLLDDHVARIVADAMSHASEMRDFNGESRP